MDTRRLSFIDMRDVSTGVRARVVAFIFHWRLVHLRHLIVKQQPNGWYLRSLGAVSFSIHFAGVIVASPEEARAKYARNFRRHTSTPSPDTADASPHPLDHKRSRMHRRKSF